MKRNAVLRSAALILAVLTAVPVPQVYAQTKDISLEQGEDSVYHITSGSDFLAFSTLCMLDSYSKGKTFVLDKDIVLSEATFVPVPSFGGTFDGCGHRISGITLRDDCSSSGLFRTIEESGRVKDLQVHARILPTGTSEKCGGIAGVNKGLISGCTFSGEVTGKRMMGGIAGVNEKTGMIAACTSEGNITAEHYSGGITGSNSGFVVRCENKADVNTVSLDIPIGVSSFNVNDLTVEKLTSAESIAAISDIGGIAGFSDGTVSDCINIGDVGYRHTGYNIGGICGRHCGYLNDCENHGTINGRKDIGGIVGQAEPYTALMFSESSAEKLRDRLSELTDEVDKAIAHTDSNTDMLSEQNTKLNNALDDLRTAADRYTNLAEGIINDDIATINELSERVSELAQRIEPITAKLDEAADEFTEALGSLSDAADILAECSGNADTALGILRPGLDDLQNSTHSLKESIGSLTESISALRDAAGDPDELKERLKKTEDCIDALRSDLESISDCADAMIGVITEYSASDPGLEKLRSSLEKMSSGASRLSTELSGSSADIEKIRQYLSDRTFESPREYKEIIDSMLDGLSSPGGAEMAEGLAEFLDCLSSMIDEQAAAQLIDAAARAHNDLTDAKVLIPTRSEAEKQADRQRLDNSIDNISRALDCLEHAGTEASAAGSDTESMIGYISEAWDHLDSSEKKLADAMTAVGRSMKSAENGNTIISDALTLVHDTADFFKGRTKLVFTGAGEDIISAREDITTLSGELLDCMEDMNSAGTLTAGVLADDLAAINAKLSEVYDAIMDIADEINGRPTDLSDFTEDISAGDTAGRSDGKTDSCINYGSVNGDISVGGIAGTMGRENALDPEGDLDTSGSRSLDFVYKTKTVVRDSLNRGDVNGKRDSVGGITGDMTMGAVISCTDTGNISSESGGYVGGIAGKSTAKIFSSSAMCMLSGGNYVGGITGLGKDIYDCTAFVKPVAFNEFCGSIAGYADGELSGNRFVENGFGGNDGVSLDNKAYPLTYEQMLTQDDIPEDYRMLRLVFAVRDDDGNIIKTAAEVEIPYGGNITDDMIPDVPDKPGYFGRWEDFDKEDIIFSDIITAQYSKRLSSAASAERDANGLVRLITEGSFTDEDRAELSGADGSYHIVLPPSAGEGSIVRYLPDGAPDRTDIYANGRLLHSERDGRYLIFTAPSSDFTIKEKKRASMIPYYAAGAAAVTAFIITAALRRRRRKKKSKK